MRAKFCNGNVKRKIIRVIQKMDDDVQGNSTRVVEMRNACRIL
jgi:hypothetical protein